MKKLFKKDSGEEHNFWMSYTDLMSGFLVVFIILSAILYIQNEETMVSRVEYDSLAAKYEKALSDLKHIDSYLHENEILKERIDSFNRNDLKNLILQFKEFDGIKGDIRVDVDSVKGSMALYHRNNKELFTEGEHEPLTPLKEFLNQYGQGIIAKAFSLKSIYPNIELRIEGHTNPKGIRDKYGYTPPYGSDASFLGNLELSSQRANSVYSYLYNSRKVALTEHEKAFLRNHAISVGYSFSERIQDGTHKDEEKYGHLDDASKRIEFRFIAK